MKKANRQYTAKNFIYENSIKYNKKQPQTFVDDERQKDEGISLQI